MPEPQTHPLKRVPSAHGSVQNPAWRVSDTADVMFNIDNSPEQNGLWSFRKILCIFLILPFLGPAPGSMPSISWIWWADIHKALITSDEMNSAWENRAEQSGAAHMRWNVLHRHVIWNQKLFLISVLKRLFSILFLGEMRKMLGALTLSLNCVFVDRTSVILHVLTHVTSLWKDFEVRIFFYFLSGISWISFAQQRDFSAILSTLFPFLKTWVYCFTFTPIIYICY